MDDEEAFSASRQQNRNIYHTFPLYPQNGGVTSRDYSGDDTERGLVSGTDDSKLGPPLRSQQLDGDDTDGDNGLEYKESISYSDEELGETGLKRRRSKTIFSLLFALAAALQVGCGVWSQCYSLIAMSLLTIYAIALLLIDRVPKSDARNKLYTASSMTVVVAGILGAVVFSIALHAATLQQNPDSMLIPLSTSGPTTEPLVVLSHLSNKTSHEASHPKHSPSQVEEESPSTMKKAEKPSDNAKVRIIVLQWSFAWFAVLFGTIVAFAAARANWRRSFFLGSYEPRVLSLHDPSMDQYNYPHVPAMGHSINDPISNNGATVTRTSYSVQAPGTHSRPIYSGGASPSNSDRISIFASSIFHSWGIWMCLLWMGQAVSVLMIAYYFFTNQYSSYELTRSTEATASSSILANQIDIMAGLIFCALDLAYFFGHLRHQVLIIFQGALENKSRDAVRLEEQLEVAKEAVENAERRREQGEIRLLRLLKMEKENAHSDLEKANIRISTTTRRMTSLQKDLERTQNKLRKFNELNRKQDVELKTARFQSVVARAEAQEMQANLARLESLERVLNQEISTLAQKLMRASVSSAAQDESVPSNKQTTAARRQQREAVQKVLDDFKSLISTVMKRDSNGETPRFDAAEDTTAISDEGVPPPDDDGDNTTSGSNNQAAGAKIDPSTGDGNVKATGGDEHANNNNRRANGSFEEQETKGHGANGPLDNQGENDSRTNKSAMLLEELEAKNAHLEERNRITMRQVTSRMQQLQDAVETQGRHIAAKEAVLSSLRDKCNKLDKENSTTKLELDRASAAVEYLKREWEGDKERKLSMFEWFKAEVEEMQRQLSWNTSEYEARMKKIHEAGESVRTLRPSLGISIQKTPNPRGLEVKTVRPEGPLYGKGVRQGHIIEYMNSVKTDSSSAVESILNQAKPGDQLSMLIGSDGIEGTKSYIVSFQLPFMTNDYKQVEPRKLREVWRVYHGIVRKTDLDPSSISSREHRQGILKPRPRRIMGGSVRK